MSNLLKNLLIALGLAIGYITFVRDAEDDSYLVSSSTPEAELESQQLLGMLNELKSLDVGGEILADPLFLSLKNFNSELGEEMSGRPNPFAPTR
jgi:hypothetical protein